MPSARVAKSCETSSKSQVASAVGCSEVLAAQVDKQRRTAEFPQEFMPQAGHGFFGSLKLASTKQVGFL